MAYAGSIDNTKGGTYYELDRVVVHEKFNGIDLFNDITLLRTAKAIAFSDNVQPIALPTAGQDVPQGTAVSAVGWGTTRVSFKK